MTPRALLIVLPLLLAACAATQPLSYLSGTPLTTTDRDLSPLQVLSVDGHIPVGQADEIPVEAGVHSLVLAYGRDHRTYAFKVEPCMRYHLGARVNPMNSHDWKLEINEKEPVSGCTVRATGTAAGTLVPATDPQPQGAQS